MKSSKKTRSDWGREERERRRKVEVEKEYG